MTSHIDDISHARICPRCYHWGPDEANFCGHCGLQLRPLLRPLLPPVVPMAAARAARRRRKRRLAVQLFGGTGLLGVLVGEHIFDSRDRD